MQQLRTEYPFTLPKGYLDADGTLHREGTMRLATARDELEPLNDPKVTNADDPYLTVIVLARVITRLGTLTRFSPRDIEGLFAADLAHLQDVYGIINYGSPAEVERLLVGAEGGAAPLSPSQLAQAAPAGSGPVQEAAAAGPASAPRAEPTAAPTGTPSPGGSPVSDAARSMVGQPRVASDDEQPAESYTPRSARRGRIEEIGRSSGLPGAGS